MVRSPADALSLDRPLTLAGVADGAEGLVAAEFSLVYVGVELGGEEAIGAGPVPLP